LAENLKTVRIKFKLKIKPCHKSIAKCIGIRKKAGELKISVNMVLIYL